MTTHTDIIVCARKLWFNIYMFILFFYLFMMGGGGGGGGVGGMGWVCEMGMEIRMEELRRLIVLCVCVCVCVK